jgi:hypothetical protein
VVAPALPRTIYLLQTDRARDGWLSVLGPLPTVRRLMLASFFFTLMFVGSSLSSHINVVTLGLDIYRMDGWPLLVVLLFLMSAAGIGASFNALFTAHSYIADGTYDSRYESSYWTRIGLGVIGGMVISQIIPLGPELPSEFVASLGQSLDSNGIKQAIEKVEQVKLTTATWKESLVSKPVLALLGGFSATMVYTVMQRLVDTVESLFKGGGSLGRDERERLVRDIVAQKFGSRAAPKPAAGPSNAETDSEATSSKVVSMVPSEEK